jgi:hypothetical protein
MRATCLRTHHRPVNEKPFKIGLNLQKNVQIHPLSWEKTHFKFVGLSEIYGFRAHIDLPRWLRYAIGATSSALLPFAFACFVERRQLWSAGACLLLLFGFYPLTLSKMAALTPFWLLFLALLARYFEPRTTTILSLLLPIGAGLMSLVTSSCAIFGLINFRMIAMPAISLEVYNDYFAHHELTHFCQVRALQLFMNCAYSEPLGDVMERAYHLGQCADVRD